MAHTRLVMMLVACDLHSDAVLEALDEAQVGDWVIIPAAQARRMGHLEYLPRYREHVADLIFGMAEAPAVAQTLDTLSQGTPGHELCADCEAYVWEARHVPLANAALDPVCEMAVDRDHTLSATYQGVHYYFCSAACRDRFLAHPEAFARQGAPAVDPTQTGEKVGT